MAELELEERGSQVARLNVARLLSPNSASNGTSLPASINPIKED
jgi:hypothetical protein